MQHTENPIALQSRKWIMESLIELMNEKTFQEITISELVAHADLVRKTFYRNFSSKEEVLEAYLNLKINDFIAGLNQQENITSEICLRQLFLLCNSNKAFLTGLSKSKMLGFLLDQWNDTIPLLHEMFLDRLHYFPNQNNATSLAYTLAFNTGGVWNVVVKWIDCGMKESPEELTGIVMKLIEFH